MSSEKYNFLTAIGLFLAIFFHLISLVVPMFNITFIENAVQQNFEYNVLQFGVGPAFFLFISIGFMIYLIRRTRKGYSIRYRSIIPVICTLFAIYISRMIMNGELEVVQEDHATADPTLSFSGAAIFLIIASILILVSSFLSKQFITPKVKVDVKDEQMLEDTLETTSEENRTQKFAKIVKRYESIEIERLAKLLDMDSLALENWLIDLPENLGFSIKKNEVIFNSSELDLHIDELMSKFSAFEEGKIGKI
ncbi:MAG: hypothetical protein INQ03_17315 [Candidatus Heimdallarchaeota archaeon]|nr:hypothetical protein [Candidatus Heimdallarchaeota archaeon]